jgi:outer membrane receptor protein involved in Fe transport
MRSGLSLSVTASVLALTAALAPASAAAQTVPADQNDSPVEATPTPTDEDSQPSSTNLSAENAQLPDTEQETIVVTGSRIRRPDFSTANPVISIGTDQIEESGTTNLTDFLTGYPALQGSSTSADNSGSGAGIGYTGLNLLNLRNLGTDRTLVLVDGRRHVAGVPGSQAIDINTIPSDLVERVDILTGGASAIYGADGVTGVVNFVLKRDFEGLSARAQAGVSEYGDAGQRLFAITAGHNFADGRGNVAVAYEHGEEDRLDQHNRKWLRGANQIGFFKNPDDPENTDPDYAGGPDNGIPDYIPLNDVRYFDTNREGGIDVDFDGFPDYLVQNGQVVAFDPGRFVPDYYQQGGNATRVSDYGNDLLPKIRRDVVNLIGHFDVSPALTIFGEAKYAKSHSFSLGQPSFDYYLYIKGDNPYLPPEVAAVAPYGDVLVTRDNFDFGQRGEAIDRETCRGVIGARGDLGSHANYELSYVYGRTEVENHYISNRITDRFFAALDVVTDPATGQPTCRVNLDPDWEPYQPYNDAIPPTTFQPGECVPLNLFGEGAPSQAALDFITADTTDKSRLTQKVLSASLSGDLGAVFTFPGGGALGYAVGAEYRKETSAFNPDPLAAQGLTFTNSLSQDKGKYSVKEAFGEVRLPLLQHLPFADNLEIGGAVRFSDYSTIGNTTAWKVDGQYSPVKDITFTGTYSTAVRAPNIGELFSGNSQTFEFIDDPCILSELQNGTQYREANCDALLTSLGADPNNYTDARSTNIPGFQGGNPNLGEETAKTWTAGVILQPRFIPGLSLRADWYDIKLKDAINFVAPEQLAQLCVDQPDLNNSFCDAIVRQVGDNGPAEAGNIISFTVGPQNVSQFRTSGLDLNLNYRLRTAQMGTFSLNVIGNYLKRLEFIGTPGADPTDSRGTAYAPKYTVNADLTWKMGRFTVNYGLLWFDKTARFSNQTLENNTDVVEDKYKYFKEHWQHDIYAAVDIDKRFTFYGGVNNVFGQKPDIGTSTYPVNSIGRFLYAGAKVKLDKIF